MSIVFRLHEPWHWRNWEPVLRHLEPAEYILHASPWVHRGEDEDDRRRGLAHTLDWLAMRGVDCAFGDLEVEPHVMATHAIDHRLVDRDYCRQVRMLYAVISKQYTYSELNADYDCVLVASHHGKRWLDKVGVRAEVVGYPKLDDAFNGRLDRASARSLLGLPADAPVVLYAPTFDKLCTVEQHGPAFSQLDPSLQLVLQTHPVQPLAEPRRFDGLDGRFHRIHPDDCGVEALVAADVVVTDYSGVAFEACAVDTPVVLLDQAGLAETDDVERRVRDFGERVLDPADLPGAVDRALADPRRFSERRAHWREQYFEHRGDAGPRAAAALRELVHEARTAREEGADRMFRRLRHAESLLAAR